MNSNLVIPVLYDFASTICFVADRVLQNMAEDLEELGVEIAWRPVDLCGLTRHSRGEPVVGARRANALRVAWEFDVPVRMPGAWLDSRAAHAVALALENDFRERTWRERMWSAVFEEGRDIGDPDELELLGREVGLDVESLAGGKSLRELGRRTREARAGGITGVPSFVIDGFPIGGIQDRHAMRDLFSRYVEKKTREASNRD